MTFARRALTVLGLVAALSFALSRPQPAAAHPLGNFTTNQYVRIELAPDDLRLVYVLDLAEIPAFQEMGRVDLDGNGVIDDQERDAFLAAKLAEIVPRFHLSIDGTEVPIALVARDLAFPDGQAGLKLLRLRAVFAAPVSGDAVTDRELLFRNDYAADRIGWREMVVTHAAGVRFDAVDAPPSDLSNELRSYPQDLLTSPLNQTAATLRFALDPGAAAAPGYKSASERTETRAAENRPGGGATGERFAALLNERELSGAGIAVALLAALLWGALHALSPGHGKTVVGAYLVGSRGTPKHALFLGLTVTLTHTAGVLALGLVTLFASRFFVPERLYPWMSFASGLLVAAIGLTVLRQRLRGQPAFGHQRHRHGDGVHAHHHGEPDAAGYAHDHVHAHGGHSHSHLPLGADGGRVTKRGLLALGISGGLIPCPSALVVLLGAIALGRVGFGMVLVLAFSFGLAAALTLVGVLFLYAGRFIERRVRGNRRSAAVLRWAPVVGALVLTVSGVVIALRALEATRLL